MIKAIYWLIFIILTYFMKQINYLLSIVIFLFLASCSKSNIVKHSIKNTDIEWKSNSVSANTADSNTKVDEVITENALPEISPNKPTTTSNKNEATTLGKAKLKNNFATKLATKLIVKEIDKLNKNKKTNAKTDVSNSYDLIGGTLIVLGLALGVVIALVTISNPLLTLLLVLGAALFIIAGVYIFVSVVANE